MANIFKAVGSLITGGMIEKAIDRVLPPDRVSEEEKIRVAHEVEKSFLKSQTDIIMAEAQSTDKVVARARPMFLYIMYAILVFNYVGLPLLQFAFSRTLEPIVLPEGAWYLFGCGYLGYTGFRSADKNQWMASFTKH